MDRDERDELAVLQLLLKEQPALVLQLVKMRKRLLLLAGDLLLLLLL